MVGMSAAILAERGFTGAPAITIEEERAALYWADLGQFWQMEHQYVKPYPICRWAHAAIDATRALMIEHDLAHEQIAGLHINSFHQAACLYSELPDTTSQAQYSLPFAVAVQAVHGRIGVEHICGAGLNDPVVAGFMQRISVAEATCHSERFPQGRWADVQITTIDGQVLESGDTHARGGPEAPMSREEVIKKYMEFASSAIGTARAAEIRDAVLSLIHPTSRFSDVAALIYDAP